MINRIISFSIWTLVVIFCAFMIGFFSWKYFGKDNILEEVSEQIIEDQLGLEIDFSPE